MLKLFFRPIGRRGFSNSRALRAAENDKNVAKPTGTTQEYVRPPSVSMDFIPSEFDKIILVLSGRYKSKAEIPSRIGYDTIDNARSRFRIRGANVLMVCTLLLCGYYIWKGKKMTREGQSLTKIYTERDKQIIAAEKERLQKQS